MTKRPCRHGKAIPIAATSILSSFFLSTALLPVSAAPARHAPKRPGAMTPLTARVSGKTEPVQTLLVHDDLPAMGTNNGVRLWVHGDGSHADLRVRVLAPSRMASPASDPLPRDTWISAPVPISFTGWREVVLPESNFTLRAAPPLPKALDLMLPADAQAAGADVSDAAPDWSAANGLALDVTTARQSTLIIDDVAWVTLDAAGQGVADKPITSFETGNIGAWRPVGLPEEARSVNYGVSTAPGLTHGGRVAFRLTVTPPGLERQGRLFYAQEAMRAARKPCLIWTPQTLFERVLPSSLPPASGSSGEVALTACPEQTQAATFCVYSPVALTDVVASVAGDLQGIGHVLPRSVVDVRVVKVRPGSGSGVLRDPDTAGAAPDILVHDDRTALSGTDTPARLTGPAVCDIAADTTKQFWVTVSVPRSTPAGSYTGRVVVSGRGLPAPVSAHLTLSVLPLRLYSPAKQYGIDLRSRLDAPPSTLPAPDGGALVTDFVSKDVLDAQLADIYAHGFTIATLYDSPVTLWDAVTEYKNYGFGTAYNLYKGDGDPQALEKQRGDHGDPALTYYMAPEPTAAAAARMAPLEKLGIPNATYIPRQADYDALGADTDIAVYNRDSEYPQQLLRTKGTRISMTRDWWYWPAAASDPDTDRVDAGYQLWKANLYGAFLPDYQTAFGTDPYDQTSAGACASKAAFRPLMLTYPVKGGVLDTLQWEACREGVTDVRYLTTMYAALRECKDAHIAKPLTAEAEGYVKAFLDKPLPNLPGGQYDIARARIASYAVDLRAAVDSYNKAHGIR